jgi:hypothetical protein
MSGQGQNPGDPRQTFAQSQGIGSQPQTGIRNMAPSVMPPGTGGDWTTGSTPPGMWRPLMGAPDIMRNSYPTMGAPGYPWTDTGMSGPIGIPQPAPGMGGPVGNPSSGTGQPGMNGPIGLPQPAPGMGGPVGNPVPGTDQPQYGIRNMDPSVLPPQSPGLLGSGSSRVDAARQAAQAWMARRGQ